MGAPTDEGDERARLAERLITAEQDERRRLALFLHDGPVQSLAGIALMLDAVGHAIEEGNLDAAKERARRRARAPPRGDPRAARPLVQPRAGRAARSGLHAGRAGARRRARHAAGDQDRRSTSRRPRSSARRCRRRSTRSSARRSNGAVRRGPPTQISVAVERGTDGRFVATIVDDGSQERRREFFDVLAERARTLNGRVCGRSGGRHEDRARAAPRARRASRIPPPMHDERQQQTYLAFVWTTGRLRAPRGARRAAGRRRDRRVGRQALDGREGRAVAAARTTAAPARTSRASPARNLGAAVSRVVHVRLTRRRRAQTAVSRMRHRA